MGKPYNLPDSVSTVLAQICCFDNQLPQGAPTSPIVSNMICSKMDSELQDLAWNTRCFYTRYADDITFSTTLREFPIQIAKVYSLLDAEIGDELEKIITSNGFKINPNKTRAFTKRQRQEVTGLTVNRFPNVRKKYVSQIRAMLHAWDKYGLEAATLEHYLLYDNKHRNPNHKPPSFKKIVGGKIEFLGMVKGHGNQQYLEFKDTYRYLSRRDKNVPFTKLPPGIESRLTIYTEGPTDKIILEIAWSKLYGDEKPLFNISSIEIKPGIGSGADALAGAMNSHRKEHGIAIAIFDNDSEGIKSYKKLHAEFVEVNNSKVCEDRLAAAFLLPALEGKEDLVELEKLWIENYFSEETLNKKSKEGRGLVLDHEPIISKKMIGKKTLSEEKIEEESIKTATIKNGKMVFARDIVPNLSSEEFEGFKLVFEKAEEILNIFEQLI